MRARNKYLSVSRAPFWWLILAHVILIALALLVFALFHHVLPRQMDMEGVEIKRTGSVYEEAAVIEETPEPVMETAVMEAAVSETEATPEPTATPEPDPVGVFASRFADKFTAGTVKTDKSYQSENISLTIDTRHEYDSDVYVVDIYIRNIENLKTFAAKDKLGKGEYEWAGQFARRIDAIVTINGDYYSARDYGVIIRNGKLYRDHSGSELDVCVLYWDGTMRVFNKGTFDADQAVQDGAYQAWSFGPNLLDADGHSVTEFNSRLLKKHPRTAIGYFEPGHYCFVVVDGRSNRSSGMRLEELSKFMEALGCKQAYNMDGGQSSVLMFGTTCVSNPEDNGRAVSDFVTIIE